MEGLDLGSQRFRFLTHSESWTILLNFHGTLTEISLILSMAGIMIPSL